MIRSSVDLPQPDGPMSETNSPWPTVEVDALERASRAARERFVRPSIETTACSLTRTCSGARWTTIFSATDDGEEEEMPSSAATMFVAQRFSGSIE